MPFGRMSTVPEQDESTQKIILPEQYSHSSSGAPAPISRQRSLDPLTVKRKAETACTEPRATTTGNGTCFGLLDNEEEERLLGDSAKPLPFIDDSSRAKAGRSPIVARHASTAPSLRSISLPKGSSPQSSSELPHAASVATVHPPHSRSSPARAPLTLSELRKPKKVISQYYKRQNELLENFKNDSEQIQVFQKVRTRQRLISSTSTEGDVTQKDDGDVLNRSLSRKGSKISNNNLSSSWDTTAPLLKNTDGEQDLEIGIVVVFDKSAMEEAAAPSALEGDPDCARHQAVLQSLMSESAQPTTSKGVPEQTPGVSADGSDSTKDSTLRALTSGSAQPATSKVVGESASAQEENPSPRPRYYIGLSGPLFHGVLETSQKGVHPVIRYSIPGGEYCYAFAYVRTVKRTQVVVYRCIACKRKGVTNSIAVQNESEFIGDPAELPHVCTPLLNAKDRVQRMMYQSCRAIAVDPTLAEAKPSQLWKSIAELIDKNAPEDEALRNEMLKQFYRNGYKSRSRTIARAAARLRRAAAGNATSEQEGEAPKPKTEEMS